MHILHVLDHSIPIIDGYAMRSQKILEALRRIGIESTVVTSPRHEHYVSGPVPAVECIDGVAHYRSGRVPKNRGTIQREWQTMTAVGKTISKLYETVMPNVIHAHSPVLNVFPALFLKRRFRIPVIYEIRAFWEDAGVDQGSHREWGPRYRLIRTLETLACLLADRVVTICEGLKRDLVRRGISPKKIHVIPNAVDPEEFQPRNGNPALRSMWGIEPQDFLLGFIGSFYRYEGLDSLIQALSQLNETESRSSMWVEPGSSNSITSTHPGNIKLLLVGHGQEERRLKSMVMRLGLEGRVIFAGRLPHGKIPDIYAILDALVLPRKSIRLTELVTPLKPLEAMAMGVPVIASDVGGHQELIKDRETGLLFTAEDVRAMASCIQLLIKQYSLRVRLAKQGRNWVCKERSWHANGERYRHLYNQVLHAS